MHFALHLLNKTLNYVKRNYIIIVRDILKHILYNYYDRLCQIQTCI